MSEEVFMRMIVLFDLPVTTKAKMRTANQFRQFLLKDGYQMLQLSIYTRIIKGRDALEKHHKRLVAHLPEEVQFDVYLLQKNNLRAWKF